jgi:hypothetical protein
MGTEVLVGFTVAVDTGVLVGRGVKVGVGGTGVAVGVSATTAGMPPAGGPDCTSSGPSSPCLDAITPNATATISTAAVPATHHQALPLVVDAGRAGGMLLLPPPPAVGRVGGGIGGAPAVAIWGRAAVPGASTALILQRRLQGGTPESPQRRAARRF